MLILLAIVCDSLIVILDFNAVQQQETVKSALIVIYCTHIIKQHRDTGTWKRHGYGSKVVRETSARGVIAR